MWSPWRNLQRLPSRDVARSVLLVVALTLGLGPAASAAAPTRRALIAFLPAHQTPAYLIQAPTTAPRPEPQEVLLRAFADQRGLSIGLLNPTQGSYSPQQMLLDISQGTRVSVSTYSPPAVPPLTLSGRDTNGQRNILGWPEVLARAEGAPQTTQPGLLGHTIPGGIAYVGTSGASHLDAAAAADHRGKIALTSISTAQSLVARTQGALRTHALAVVDLPPDAPGSRALAALLAQRTTGELVIVMQTPPGSGGRLLMPIGITGFPTGSGLSSPTTTLPGLVAAIDIAPTVLTHLGLAIPAAMRGRAITRSEYQSTDELLAFKRRLLVITGRRNPTLQVMVMLWVGVLLALGALAGWARARAPALRIGGLAFMWLPATQLLGGLTRPGQGSTETLMIAASAFLLAAVTDRVLPWPRGPMLPAITSILVLALDAGLGGHLLVQSILGPSPASGSRFFGIGNELKSGLTCLLLVGLAAAFGTRQRSRRLAGIVAGNGLLLGIILGSARLGAGVGGVIIVAAGTATATVLVLPGRASKRRLAAAALSPIAALILLAGIDLLTAGGQGHYVHNVLDGGGQQNLIDIITRRTTLAYQGLSRGGMPLMIAITSVAVIFALRNRWLYAGLPGPMWRAALLGGLTAAIVGSVVEDSGPLLFVVAVFVLAAATAYGQGQPLPAGRAGPKL